MELNSFWNFNKSIFPKFLNRLLATRNFIVFSEVVLLNGAQQDLFSVQNFVVLLYEEFDLLLWNGIGHL